MAIHFSTYALNNRLQFASQFSNAVLVNGFGHNCEGAFDYVRNVMSIPYQYGEPSEREIAVWKRNQAHHPSLAEKYKVSSATVYRKSKADHWKVPDNPELGSETNETRNETGNETGKPVDSKKIEPSCFSDNETDKPKRNKPKRNETANETTKDPKDFDIKSYVSTLTQNFDPSRARDKKYLDYQLSQIDEHLGDLSSVFDGCGFSGKYRPEFARIAYNIALLGGTPESLGKTLNVSEQTIYNWLNTYQEFHIAWHGGKEFADANVVKALYKRAVGYQIVVEDYKTEKGELVPVEKTLVFAGDVQAQQFWLKNRRPHDWKEKVEVQEEIKVAVIDKAAADEMYTRVINKAAELKSQFNNRAQRLGLVLDGESKEVDND